MKFPSFFNLTIVATVLLLPSLCMSKTLYKRDAGFVRKVDIKLFGVYQHSEIDVQDKRISVVQFDASRPFGEQFFLNNVGVRDVNAERGDKRRIKLGIKVKLAQGFSFRLQTDDSAKDPDNLYGNERRRFDQVWLAWNANKNNQLKFGYSKVPFGIEQQIGSSHRAIEHSVAGNYFTGGAKWGGVGRPNGFVSAPLGIGNRHVGFFADLGGDRLAFRIAITRETFNPLGHPDAASSRDLGFYGSVIRRPTKEWPYEFGINFAWLPDGVVYFPVEQQRFASLQAINPYFRLELPKIQVIAEYFQSKNARGRYITGGFEDLAAADRAAAADDANPRGVTVTAIRKFQEQFEVVARFSYLDTDGSGFSNGSFSGVASRVPFASRSNNFDKAESWYIGFNMQVTPKFLFKIGYERLEATDDLYFLHLYNNTNTLVSEANARRGRSDSAANIDIWRAQLEFSL